VASEPRAEILSDLSVSEGSRRSCFPTSS